MVFCLLEGVASIYLNTFIVFVSGRSCANGPKMKPIHLIYLIMGINNLAMRCTQVIEEAGFWFPVGLEFFDAMDIYLDVHICITNWLTAFLGAYYCLNISNFSPRMLASMKRNLSTLLPYMLFLTGVGSLVINLLYLWKVEIGSSGLPMNGTLNASSISETIFDGTLVYTIFLTSFGCCLPFAGVVFFLLVTVTSLLRRVWEIGYTGSNVQVYTAVIKTMVMFLILSVLFYVSDIVNYVTEANAQSFVFLIIWLLMLIFPSAEALIIIQASPKLRKTFPRWLCGRGNGNN